MKKNTFISFFLILLQIIFYYELTYLSISHGLCLTMYDEGQINVFFKGFFYIPLLSNNKTVLNFVRKKQIKREFKVSIIQALLELEFS